MEAAHSSRPVLSGLRLAAWPRPALACVDASNCASLTNMRRSVYMLAYMYVCMYVCMYAQIDPSLYGLY